MARPYSPNEPVIEGSGRPVQDRVKTNRDVSIIHETRIAKKIGGRTIKNSGASFRTGQDRVRDSGVRTDHADITTEDFKIEHKLTQNASLSLKKSWLQEIRTSAKNSMKFPALAFSFVEPNGGSDDWVAIPLELFEQIKAKL